MKYRLCEIATNNDGVIDMPNGSIPIGEPIRTNEIINSMTESTCHIITYIKVWVPIENQEIE